MLNIIRYWSQWLPSLCPHLTEVGRLLHSHWSIIEILRSDWLNLTPRVRQVLHLHSKNLKAKKSKDIKCVPDSEYLPFTSGPVRVLGIIWYLWRSCPITENISLDNFEASSPLLSSPPSIFPGHHFPIYNQSAFLCGLSALSSLSWQPRRYNCE